MTQPATRLAAASGRNDVAAKCWVQPRHSLDGDA
jgi:hypothetical protein